MCGVVLAGKTELRHKSRVKSIYTSHKATKGFLAKACMLFREIIAVYFENQSAEFLNIRPSVRITAVL
jgi:hypothetical protein